jgi:hypothetical protein
MKVLAYINIALVLISVALVQVGGLIRGPEALAVFYFIVPAVALYFFSSLALNLMVVFWHK